MTQVTQSQPATKRPRKMARQRKSDAVSAPVATTAPAKPPSKSALVIQLLGRSEGATIDQLVAATGWLAHTTRAALTGLRKKGHVITSEKPAEGPRIYRVAGSAAASA